MTKYFWRVMDSDALFLLACTLPALLVLMSGFALIEVTR